MTRREMQALARIISDHEFAAAGAAADEANNGTPFPAELRGAIATDDRILSEVLHMDQAAARRFKDRAVGWIMHPQLFQI